MQEGWRRGQGIGKVSYMMSWEKEVTGPAWLVYWVLLPKTSPTLDQDFISSLPSGVAGFVKIAPESKTLRFHHGIITNSVIAEVSGPHFPAR